MTSGVFIEAVDKAFGGASALRQVSARIDAGRLTGVVGPDGAGKTTLMRLMAALLRPDGGTITVAGYDSVAEADAIHAVIGYMPQNFGLYQDLSVAENLALYGDLKGLAPGQRSATFQRLLGFTGLADFRQRLAGALSGGMKQKLGLACALMGDPHVLLLDEPSVGVDPVSRRELWAMVASLAAEGMAVVWSTAYLDEAERCDHVLLLREGTLEFAGAPQALTGAVAGRTFVLEGAGARRRALLARALTVKGVKDGVIQGGAVRVVVESSRHPAGLDALAGEYGARLTAARARFEDAFIDHLGGGPGGRSVIAERMPELRPRPGPTVCCRHLTKRFGGFTAAEDVSFEVARGEIFGLLGPNGAGKSTTFKMLCGLARPSAGSAEVMGQDLRTAPGAAKQNVGYMAQKFSLYGLLSVRQNLELFSGIYGLSGRERRQRVGEMVDAFELGPLLNDSPDRLALGHKQRLALACALMHRPPVLFLDEPTSGVDPITRREFWAHINALVRKGVTVMVTTHFMDEAEYCDRVAMMHRGRLIALAPPDDLKARAASDETVEPTMEEAFIALVEHADRSGAAQAAAGAGG